MLEIIIPEQHYTELWDGQKEEFLPPVDIKETRLQIEHSLISLKKWEQTWHKPFFNTDDKTYDELCDYIRCMTLTHNVDSEVYYWIPQNVIDQVVKYIKDPMTATTITEHNIVEKQRNTREGITAEIIYYWMIILNIPVEFQKWHLNQLLTLIKVVSIKNGKQEKMDPKEAARQRAELNRARRKMYNSKG